MNKGFTTIHDIDSVILNALDDHELVIVCQSNSYIASLCQEKHFQSRIERYHNMIKFFKNPLINPENNQSIKLYDKTFTSLVDKYGMPQFKLISPVSGREIVYMSVAYRNLIQHGYTDQDLLKI